MNKTTESAELQNLLTNFHAASLGEGAPNAGTNLLAAMAVTLANVAPDTPARVGTNLLVTGARSAGRLVEEVVTEVGQRWPRSAGAPRP